MAQILKGTTFTPGGTVTDTNLNNHVDNATLQADAIDAQTAATTLTTSDTLLVTVGAALRKVTLANLLKVSPIIGGTTPAAVTATELTVTGAATFDMAPNFNGGANLGNAAADPVVLNCTLSGTLKGEPVVNLTSATAAVADKVLIQDASDASKLKVAAFPIQYVKAFVRANSSGTILGTALNVTSVVRNGQGIYTVTFTTAMTTATYSAVATSHSNIYAHVVASVPTSTTASCVVWTSLGSIAGPYDSDFSLTIFEA